MLVDMIVMSALIVIFAVCGAVGDQISRKSK